MDIEDFKLIPILHPNDDTIIDYAIVDSDDYDHLMQWKWYYTTYGYVTNRKANSECELMHRMVMGLVKNDGKVLDHINRTRKDNRKTNLRICTRAENARNTKRRNRKNSKFKIQGN